MQNHLTGNERKAEAAAKITKWSAQQKAHSMALVDVLIAREALIAPVTPAATWWMEWAASSQAVLSGPRRAVPGRRAEEDSARPRLGGPAVPENAKSDSGNSYPNQTSRYILYEYLEICRRVAARRT